MLYSANDQLLETHQQTMKSTIAQNLKSARSCKSYSILILFMVLRAGLSDPITGDSHVLKRCIILYNWFSVFAIMDWAYFQQGPVSCCTLLKGNFSKVQQLFHPFF